MTDLTGRVSLALADRYQVERRLGEGGMATVYLAEDLKHGRRVAVKVLRPELAAVLGAERFIQEIRTTASLQHPHILPLFDSGQAAWQDDGTSERYLYYVMPYVEGESLRDRLNRETQLGVAEAVRITQDVADALDYAHRHGVIHRDIKPENILLHDGRPMVADFGIALAVSAAAGGRMTETGLSLGTPHYMSPEQATADRALTNRSDVYSLGCVLYEMLAGEPPHTGASAQAIIMKIVADPARPVTELRRSVPPNVAHALARALEKIPADRFESAAAFAAALADERYSHRLATAGARGAPAPAEARASRAPLLAMAGVTALALAAAAWGWLRTPPSPAAAVLQLTLDVEGRNPEIRRMAISPDGRAFAVATDDGLAVRRPGEPGFRVIPGTANAESPAFSPDGGWLAYSTGGRLRKVAVSGGMALPLVLGDSTLGGWPSWGDDGTVVFLTAQGVNLIPPDGGPPRLLRGTAGAQVPRPLPDGSGVLYVDARAGSRLMLFDRAADTARVVVPQSASGQYVATGHLVYGHPAGGLFAVPFDLKRREVTGPPVPLVENIRMNGSVAPFAVSRSGTLLYRAGLRTDDLVLRLDLAGRVDTLPLAPRSIGYLRFAPDGRSLAITTGTDRGTDRHIAIYDLALGSLTQITFEGGGHSPVWSPDGRRLAFTAEATDTEAEDLFVQPIDGSAPPRLVTRLPGDQHATSWPADSQLVFTSENDILTVDPDAREPKPRPYLAGEWVEQEAVVSPDGRHAAYVSAETGASEVFIRAFPRAGGQWKVSEGGGRQPRWAPDGRTVYYQAGAQVGSAGLVSAYQEVVAARLGAGPTPAVVSRRVVVSLPGLAGAWDVDRRSGRAVAAQAVRSEDVKVVVVVNWLDELRSRTAAAGPAR